MFRYLYILVLIVIGTNLGAALVDVERGTSTWVCRSKSDVLAQQFDKTVSIISFKVLANDVKCSFTLIDEPFNNVSVC